MITVSRSVLSISLCLFCGALGCSKRSHQAPIDACTLLKNAEIEAVQGSPVKETKSSAQVNSGFRVAQCFYTATEFSKSVVLTVTQRDPAGTGNRSVHDYWGRMFDPHKKKERGEEGDHDSGEEAVTPPRKIDRVGEDARWTGMRFGGALYVLKNDIFIRISVGSGTDEENRINRSKTLALKALARL